MNEEDLFAKFEDEMAEMPCEMPAHGFSEQHAGPGVWYMTAACPHCGEGPPSALVCDRYKQYLPVMVAISGSTVVKCSHCDNYFLSKAITYQFERREP